MARKQRLLYLLSALVAVAPQIAQAATVVRTTTQLVSFGQNTSGTFSFADISNADQLISISAGSVNSVEGGSTFAITANYSNATSAQIFSQGFVPLLLFSSLSNLSFPVGTINGITFSGAGIAWSGSVPVGTVFTFHTTDVAAPTIPEPATWAFLITGFAAVGGLMRDRRRRTLVKPV